MFANDRYSYINFENGSIVVVFDGGDSVISTGTTHYVEVPLDCKIISVTMLADQSGDLVIDVWKDSYNNYPPTNEDSITASATPTLSSAIKYKDSTLSGWTTDISENDILAFSIEGTPDSITRCTICLKIERV